MSVCFKTASCVYVVVLNVHGRTYAIPLIWANYLITIEYGLKQLVQRANDVAAGDGTWTRAWTASNVVAAELALDICGGGERHREVLRGWTR